MPRQPGCRPRRPAARRLSPGRASETVGSGGRGEVRPPSAGAAGAVRPLGRDRIVAAAGANRCLRRRCPGGGSAWTRRSRPASPCALGGRRRAAGLGARPGLGLVQPPDPPPPPAPPPRRLRQTGAGAPVDNPPPDVPRFGLADSYGVLGPEPSASLIRGGMSIPVRPFTVAEASATVRVGVPDDIGGPLGRQDGQAVDRRSSVRRPPARSRGAPRGRSR